MTQRTCWPDAYLNVLHNLPFVEDVAVVPVDEGGLAVKLTLPSGCHTLIVEVVGGPLKISALERLRSNHRGKAWLLLAPRVRADLVQPLADCGVNFVDAAGNCHVALGTQHVLHVEGRGARLRSAERHAWRPGECRVLFALLARPDLLGAPLERIAASAGVGPLRVAVVLRCLEIEGIVGRSGRERVLLRHDDLLDYWQTGYVEVLRPRLLVGRYSAPDPEPAAMERRIEQGLSNRRRWALGGSAAACRLTGLYRGHTTVLHLGAIVPDLGARLGVREDPEGLLIVLRAPGPLAFDGPNLHLAHPLLVYTELQIPG